MLSWRKIGRRFMGGLTMSATVTSHDEIRPMTEEELERFDQAFRKFDEAFEAFDQVFRGK